ncbi:hypothetical protein BDW22DRAFT_1352687 [Trametopsis cervina]|nr:hypothetical protein BDW22DRAFT_1352687 [Trametopsis cervina]
MSWLHHAVLYSAYAWSVQLCGQLAGSNGLTTNETVHCFETTGLLYMTLYLQTSQAAKTFLCYSELLNMQA